jgi:cytochrome c-type biogenesis protein CcmH/NrfG
MAVARNPKFDRAWYNLGLLLAQKGELPDAIGALSRAAALAPQEADYSYALATVLLRSGDRAGSRQAALRTLRLVPDHAGARQVLRALQ